MALGSARRARGWGPAMFTSPEGRPSCAAVTPTGFGAIPPGWAGGGVEARWPDTGVTGLGAAGCDTGGLEAAPGGSTGLAAIAWRPGGGGKGFATDGAGGGTPLASARRLAG